MNPLEVIRKWIDSIDEETLIDLIAIGQIFHPETSLKEAGTKEKIAVFKDYLSSSELSDAEIVQKTLFTIKWIDFNIQERGTEAFWSKGIDKNLDMRNHISDDQGAVDFIDKMLSSFPERKKKWIRLVANWNNLLNGELSDEHIKDWFIDRLMEQRS